MINTAKRTVNIWIALTIAFIFGIFAPSIFGMDGFNGGFAISFLCIILVITGLVVILMYWGRARAADSLLREENILAHWTYTAGQWKDYSERNYRMEKSEKWKLYSLVMAITGVVTLGFWLGHRDSGQIMVGVFLGLGILLSCVVWLTTTYAHWQNMRYHGEVYISRNGAYVGRQLHLWKGWGASLDTLNYDKTNQMIAIEYSMPSRNGRDTTTVRIPVPNGQEEKASQIVDELGETSGI